MKRLRLLLVIFFLSGLVFFALQSRTVHAQTPEAVVHAALFYSPNCPHCHLVINETLPPLVEKYGEQLQIIAVDVTQPEGGALFLAALQKFELDAGGVPFLVVGDAYLFGSLQIPEEFPGLIEAYLAQGGVDWPDIPGLREGLAAAGQTEETMTTPTAQTVTDSTIPQSTAVSPGSPSPTALPELSLPANPLPDPDWRGLFAQDPAGNTLSVLVLIGMIGSVLWAATLFRRANSVSLKDSWAWAIPVLSLAGLGVAGYLSYVETMQVAAVCGPVGDCNTVQQSEYAKLFGVLPIGVLGLGGYIAIITAWLIARYVKNSLSNMAALGLLALTSSGTLFSIYLTFLEPFVIGATCAWCLTSSVLITLLMLLSVAPAKTAFSRNSFYTSLRRRY